MQCSEICCNEEDRTRLQGVKNKKQKDEKVNWKFFIIYGKGEENRVNIKGKRKTEKEKKKVAWQGKRPREYETFPSQVYIKMVMLASQVYIKTQKKIKMQST